MYFDGNGETVVTFFSNGQMTTLTSAHEEYNRVLAALKAGEDPSEILNPVHLVTKLDERVAVREAELLFDGKPIHNNLAKTIIRYNREGRDSQNLVKFLERLNNNPSEHSRAQLFDWAESLDLTIDKDGYIIGFKGVTPELTSLNEGTAWVNGIETTGKIPNEIGSVISMPREMVQADPKIGCSHGLHIGTYNYAKQFGKVVVIVKLDPADVVSVPSDSGFAKLRACKYEVIDVHEGSREAVRAHEPESTKEDVVPDIEDIVGETVPLGWISKIKAKIGKWVE